jgi:hypothetical protein
MTNLEFIRKNSRKSSLECFPRTCVSLFRGLEMVEKEEGDLKYNEQKDFRCHFSYVTK